MMSQMMQQQMMRSMQQRPNRGAMMGGGMMGRGMMGMAAGGRGGVDKRAPAMGAGGGGSAGGQASETGGAGGAAGGMAAKPGPAGQPEAMAAAMAGGMMGGRGGPGGGRRRRLSLAIVSAATELAIRDKNPKSKMIHKKLDEPISMSFVEETPLEDVLKYIKQATTTKRTRAYRSTWTPRASRKPGKTIDLTVKDLDLEGIPLKTTLRLVLKQLDLAYCVHDGVLIISSPQGVFDELERRSRNWTPRRSIEETKQAEERGRKPERPQRKQSASHSTIVGPSEVPFGSPRLVEGSSITKVEPCPGWDVTEILPPCSRMIFCETGKPRPVPREPLVEANNWKIDGISASSIPTPLSLTLMRASGVSASHSVLIETRAFSEPSQASIALVTMFRTARWMPSVSIMTRGSTVLGFQLSSTPSSCARDCISSTTSPTVSFKSASSRSGSRSFENESMSITRL